MRTELKGEGVNHLVNSPLSGTNRWTDWIQRVPESGLMGAIKKKFIFSGCEEDLLCKNSKFKHFYWLLL